MHINMGYYIHPNGVLYSRVYSQTHYYFLVSLILSSSLNLNVNSIHFPNNNINKIILQIGPSSISITTQKYDLF